MNSAIDAGILRLAEMGRLSATSCLTDGAHFVRDAPALRDSGLQAGLHLNFTEALGGPGLFLPVSALIMRAYARRLDLRVVREQIARQLDHFENVMQRVPYFVDGHQHIHQLPQIRDALLDELAGRYDGALPWLRSTRMRSQPTVPARVRFKGLVIQVLGSGPLARAAKQRGFVLNEGFLGVYDFQGGVAAYEALLQAWLRHAQAGDMLMCHPAASVDERDALGAQRAAEFQVLMADITGHWLRDNGLEVA